MPLFLIALGAVLIDVSFRGTEHELATQASKDFSGGHYWAWAASIGILGGIGYYPPARKLSDAFIGLVLVSFFLSQNGLIANLSKILASPPSPAPSIPLPAFSLFGSSGTTSGIAAALGGGGSSGFNASSAGQILSGAAGALLSGALP